MIRKKIDIDYLIYILLVILPIYKDSPLGNALGSFGYSYVPVLCWIMFGLYVICKQKIVINNEIVKTFFVLGIWIVLVSIFMMVIWGVLGNDMYILGEFLPVKLVKVILVYGAFPIYISMIYNKIVKYNFDRIFRPICVVFFLLFIICVMELIARPYAFQYLHASSTFPYYGMRLLTKEASWTSLLIYNYFMLALYYALSAKKNKLAIIMIICELMMIFVSSSKSLLLIFGITICLMINFQRKKISKKKFILMLLVFAGLIYFFLVYIFPILQTYFVNDLLLFTSVATRSYTLFIGFLLGIIFPFGVGGTLYLYFYPELLNKYMSVFQTAFPNLNMSEVYFYLGNNTDDGLVPKSGFGQYTMFWGVFGTIYLFVFFYKLYKLGRNKEDQWMFLLITAFVGNIIMTLFAIEITFEFLLLLTVVFVLIKRKEKG